MLLHTLICVIPLFGFVSGEQVALKMPFSKNDQTPHAPKVAIIGAGIAGASAAYRLHDQYAHAGIDITIFEANPHQVETGAQSFYTDDECIQSLLDETGLRQKLKPHYMVQKSARVWDSANFKLRGEDDLKARTCTDWARYAWRYGFSVSKMRKWLSEKLPPFQRLLGRWKYANHDIPGDIENLGLTPELKNNAWSFMHNLTSPEFSREIVQPSTRAWFGQDLVAMHGLAALAAMNPAATDSVMNGGNHKLIERLIKLSDVAHRDQDTEITNTKISSHHYDAINMAAPLQMANIEFDIDIHIAASSPRPYTSRYVTHFTSFDPLSPTYFNLSTNSSMPSKIYTTTSTNIPPCPFFSIEHSLASLGLDGCNAQSENMYRVVTASPLSDAVILDLLGQDPNRALEDTGVRWVHRRSGSTLS